MFEPFPDLPIQVRQFKIVEEIGRGGCGCVYRAINLTYNIDFALKVFPAPTVISSAASLSFDTEVKSLLKLDHANVIRMYDYFQDNGLLFLVLEYCAGDTLENKLANVSEDITYEQQLTYCSQIISALNYCHQNSIAHRDIKTSNILFDSHGRIKMADFGISSCLQKNMKIKSFNGSYLYAPPEILQKKEYDPFSADIWSLGVLFYCLATSEYPWPMKNKEQTKKAIINCQYQYLPAKHPLAKVIKQMLMFDPKERITIDELQNMEMFKNHGFVPKKGRSSLQISISIPPRETKKKLPRALRASASFDKIKLSMMMNSNVKKSQPCFHKNILTFEDDLSNSPLVMQ